MHGFRPGTKLPKLTLNFVYMWGGLGDYVCWSAALQYIHRTQPQVRGKVWAPPWFIPLAARMLPDWEISDREKLKPDTIVFRSYSQAIPQGIHPIDYGFMMFTNENQPPADWSFMPELPPIKPNYCHGGLPYVVLTPYATNATRTMPVAVYNALAERAREHGFETVHIGSHRFAKRESLIEEGYDLSGTNLLNQTSLLEAHALMSGARAVIGLDNGLLHLAACSEVPLLFGYSIAAPRHRRPRRRSGVTVDVTPPESLPCRFCQSTMRFIPMTSDFGTCFYKDEQCLKDMTPELWCAGFDELLRGTR